MGKIQINVSGVSFQTIIKNEIYKLIEKGIGKDSDDSITDLPSYLKSIEIIDNDKNNLLKNERFVKELFKWLEDDFFCLGFQPFCPNSKDYQHFFGNVLYQKYKHTSLQEGKTRTSEDLKNFKFSYLEKYPYYLKFKTLTNDSCIDVSKTLSMLDDNQIDFKIPGLMLMSSSFYLSFPDEGQMMISYLTISSYDNNLCEEIQLGNFLENLNLYKWIKRMRNNPKEFIMSNKKVKQ